MIVPGKTSRRAEIENVHILADKITAPAAPAHRISRVRLLTPFRESLECCAATIVSGRRGTGKTVLATDFVRHAGRAAAWYKVDAPDSELRVFFQYLCASVREQRPAFGQRVLERLGSLLSIEDVPLLVEYFIYELLEHDAPLLVVIDDLHLVYDAEWVVHFFRRLLPLLPPEVHFVLIGRSLPPAPLWRMRSKQTLRVVEERELAFNLQEAQRLFAGFGLSNEQAFAAWEQTHGRASSLVECAQLLSLASAPLENSETSSERREQSGRLRLVKGYTSGTSFKTA